MRSLQSSGSTPKPRQSADVTYRLNSFRLIPIEIADDVDEDIKEIVEYYQTKTEIARLDCLASIICFKGILGCNPLNYLRQLCLRSEVIPINFIHMIIAQVCSFLGILPAEQVDSEYDDAESMSFPEVSDYDSDLRSIDQRDLHNAGSDYGDRKPILNMVIVLIMSVRLSGIILVRSLKMCLMSPMILF